MLFDVWWDITTNLLMNVIENLAELWSEVYLYVLLGSTVYIGGAAALHINVSSREWAVIAACVLSLITLMQDPHHQPEQD